jgi:intracellular sulfur oxidation DsrE/DsrF family protein
VSAIDAKPEQVMNRRSLLCTALSSVGAGLLASRANAVTADEKPPAKLKVAYHLADADRVSFALSNIQNHFDGVGGPDNVTIALVVLGPALRAFALTQANPDMTSRVAKFAKAGLQMAACANTMRAQEVTLTQLQPGFTIADRGGVVKIAELQSQGYLYIRP